MLNNIPNTCLLGIALTVTSHTGPQLVYHYPPSGVKINTQNAASTDQLLDGVDADQEVLDYDEYLENSDSDFAEYQRKSHSNFSNVDQDSNLNESKDNDGTFNGNKNSAGSELPQPNALGPSFLSDQQQQHQKFSTTPNETHHSILQKQSRNSIAFNDFKQEYEAQENFNDLENVFDESGLSDSELSTDYADYSDGSSESSSRSRNSDDVDDMHNRDTLTSAPISVSTEEILSDNKSDTDNNISNKRTSSISAKKIFQVLNHESGAAHHPTVSDAKSLDSFTTPTTSKSASSKKISPQAKEFVNLINTKFPTNTYSLDSKVQGFDSDFFAEFCCPPKSMCNTRFELTVDELCFLGLPIHCNDDGNWRNSSKSQKKRKKKSLEQKQNTEDTFSTTDAHAGGDYDERKTNKSTLDEDASSVGITMFNLVFIMDPQLVEFDFRTDDMFHYISKRFSLFLRYLQGKTNFVSKEAYKILKIKERSLNSTHQTVYKRILARSSLARSITQCYEKVVNNEIANLIIDNDKFLALQIPIKNEFATLPNYKIDPVLNGSYLTSILNQTFLQKSLNEGTNASSKITNGPLMINSSGAGLDEADLLNDNLDINSLELLNHALLFIKDPSEIIEELQKTSGDNDLTTVIMIALVKNLKPTLPLKAYKRLIHDIITTHADNDDALSDDDEIMTPTLCLNMLKSFALHFMYWRQARAILPLSSKNTYIVSPLAPMKGIANDDFDPNIEYENLGAPPLIYQNCALFKERFPTLPKLSVFLSMISKNGSVPRPFEVFIPSSDHKPVYLTALSWLIRQGYVTQLLTFVYIRIGKRIKIAVEEDLEKEGLLKIIKRGSARMEKRGKHTVLHKSRSSARGSDSLHSENESLVTTSDGDLQYGMKSDSFTCSSHNYDYGDDDDDDDDDDDASSFFSSESHGEREDYTIILEPRIATALEKRWLYKCVEDFTPAQQLLFHKLLKYFNGKIPMEYVLIKENVSRHDLNKLFASLGKYLIELKHW
ncbi:hypothetical protein ACO0QE_003150 [Hanseniaspora vineae]